MGYIAPCAIAHGKRLGHGFGPIDRRLIVSIGGGRFLPKSGRLGHRRFGADKEAVFRSAAKRIAPIDQIVDAIVDPSIGWRGGPFGHMSSIQHRRHMLGGGRPIRVMLDHPQEV